MQQKPKHPDLFLKIMVNDLGISLYACIELQLANLQSNYGETGIRNSIFAALLRKTGRHVHTNSYYFTPS